MGSCSGTVVSYFWTRDEFGETSTHTDSKGEVVREYVGEHHTHRSSSSLCGSLGTSAALYHHNIIFCMLCIFTQALNCSVWQKRNK